MIETLFGYAPTEKNKTGHKQESAAQDSLSQEIQLIDSKKSQNLAILLRALNVTTEEFCDAIQEGEFHHYSLVDCFAVIVCHFVSSLIDGVSMARNFLTHLGSNRK